MTNLNTYVFKITPFVVFNSLRKSYLNDLYSDGKRSIKVYASDARVLNKHVYEISEYESMCGSLYTRIIV